MRALRFHAAKDIRIEEVPGPPDPGAGEVVVRVATCGICGTDLHEYAAGPIVTPVEPHPLTGAQNPQIRGHEFSGDVVAAVVATVLDPTSIDVPELLHEPTDGLGVDVAIECSGHPTGFNAAVRSLRRRGTLAQTGLFVGEASVEPMLWSLNDLTIVGTWCYWVYDFDRIAAQIAAGSLPVERVVSSSVNLDGAPDAFARLASGAADEIKVLIDQ